MIKRFLWIQRGTILTSIIAAFLFPIYQFLLDVPLNDIFYIILLYFVTICCYLVIQYYKFQKKNKYLGQLNEEVSIYPCVLPESENEIELQYQQLIKQLYEKIKIVLEEKEEMYQNNLEYFTLWLHQIKTPISAMKLLLEEQETVKTNILEIELFEIERYVELVLQFMKLKSIETDLIIEVCDLEKLINQIVKKYAILCITQNIQIQIKNCKKEITTDNKWFTFILEQIFSNAVKYTAMEAKKKQELIIVLETKETKKEIIITVKDNGIGIKQEDLTRVFEKGYTGLNGRIDKKASGIGLYLANKVCSSLNHRIVIESEVGIGTNVYLYVTKL